MPKYLRLATIFFIGYTLFFIGCEDMEQISDVEDVGSGVERRLQTSPAEAYTYSTLIACLAKINPITQTIAVKVRFSLLMARAKEKSWSEGFG